MAIKKQQVIDDVSAEMAQAVLEIEKVIDEKLRVFVDGNHITIQYSALPFPKPTDYPFRNRVVQELIKRYKAAGWTVTAESDQRDGSWLDFS